MHTQGTFNPEDGNIMNRLRKKIIAEIKHQEWAAKFPEEAAAFQAEKERVAAEANAQLALIAKKKSFSAFSHIPALKDQLDTYKTGLGMSKWARNW